MYISYHLPAVSGLGDSARAYQNNIADPSYSNICKNSIHFNSFPINLLLMKKMLIIGYYFSFPHNVVKPLKDKFYHTSHNYFCMQIVFFYECSRIL